MKFAAPFFLMLLPAILCAQKNDTIQIHTDHAVHDSLSPLKDREYSVIQGEFSDHGKNMATYEFSFLVPNGVKEVDIRIELILDDKIHPHHAVYHPRHAMVVDATKPHKGFEIHHEWQFPETEDELSTVGKIILPLHVKVDRAGWIPVALGIQGHPGESNLVVWMGKTFVDEFHLAGFPSKISTGKVLAHLESNSVNLVEEVLGFLTNSKFEGMEFPAIRKEKIGDQLALEWWCLNRKNLAFFEVFRVTENGSRQMIRMMETDGIGLESMSIMVDPPTEKEWIEIDMEMPNGTKVVGEIHAEH